MELILTKTKHYDLEPFGNFMFKWNKPMVDKPNVIYIGEVIIDKESSMPLTQEQKKSLFNEMKKYNTDVFRQGHTFYTRTESGLTPIRHKKLTDFANK